MYEQQKPMVSPTTLFYSYAHEDEILRNELEKHLRLLSRQGLISEWHDRQILAGNEWAYDIDEHLEMASIILLLISPDFLASDYCYDTEMKRALERHQHDEARVVPIIVRPCDWQTSPFAHLQCLPRDGKAITTWENRDEAFLTIAQELRRVITQRQFPNPLLSDTQRRNRTRLLKRVRTMWIEGLLEHSLHRAVLIDLHLQEQPDALENPWRLQVQELDQTSRALPVGTSIVEVYDEADGELLILGEPGSGKTTLLLQLVRTLLDRAEADERHSMPVVFNLSSWAQKQEPLATWLVEELKTKYHVPSQVGQHWIEANQVLPLLDGLDEVAYEVRMACVQAITAYYHQHPSQAGTPVVVCCRSEEYQALSTRLPLQRAVSILPLSDEQVDTYLSSAQGQLEGLRHLLRTDVEFAELAHRPLVLSIAILAYHGKRVVNFPSVDNSPSVDNFPVSASQEQLLRIVFATYVEQMLSRRGKLPHWMQVRFLPWLTYLARHLYQQQQTVFSVEDLQPDWLPVKQQRLYRWSFGLFVGLIFGLFFGLVAWLTFGLVAGLIAGLIFGLAGGLFSVIDIRIRPAEVITWSWENARGGLGGALIFGLVFGLIFGLVGVLVGALVGVLLSVLVGGISSNRLTERARLSPNEGIWRSAKNGLVVWLGIMLVGILVGGLLRALSEIT